MANESLACTPELNDSECLHVLLVEASQVQGNLLQELLTNKNDYGIHLNLTWVLTLADGLTAIEAHEFDVVLLDLDLLDGKDGEVIRTIKIYDPNATIIILTNTHEDSLNGSLEYLREGAQDYLVKSHLFGEAPNNQEMIFRSINYALERNYLLQQLQKEYEQTNAILQAINDTVVVCDRDNVCTILQNQNDNYCTLIFHYLMQVISQDNLTNAIEEVIGTNQKKSSFGTTRSARKNIILPSILVRSMIIKLFY
ncbi:MAG: response regulator [Synechococcaceae cyanobacterium RL_1_2]|nr:response regulator [Synechococcaceae cyanobacterium RL_1_2]